MEEKIERLPGLTVKALVVGVIAVAATCAWFSMGGLIPNMNWYPTWVQDQNTVPVYGFLFIFILLLALINAVKPIFTVQEIAVIIIMFYIGTSNLWFIMDESVDNIIIWQFWSGAGLAITWPERLLYADPMVWGPIRDADTARNILIGSTWNIPWGMWAPTISWTLIFFGSYAFMMIFLAMLLRHMFIRVEGMRFPLASIDMDLVNTTQKTSQSIIRGSFAKYFWLGFIISFGICIPILHNLAVLYPYVPGSPPSTIGWYNVVWTKDLTIYGFLPWVDLCLEPWPWMIAFAYLWPMDCINGFLFGWLLYHIIFPQIFLALGWIPPMPLGTDMWTVNVNWFQRSFPAQMPGFKQNIVAGSLIVIALYPLFRNREAVKKMFQGLTRPVPEIEEDGRLMSLRTIWAGLIVSVIISIIAWSIAGAPVWMAILLVVLSSIILVMGRMSLAGDTPGRFGSYAGHHIDGYNPLGALYLFSSGMHAEQSTAATFTNNFVSDWQHSQLPMHFPTWACGTLVAFRLADEARVRISDMAKAAIIAMLTWLIVTVLASVIWPYVWSFPVGSPGYGRVTWFGDTLRARSDPAIRDWGWQYFPANAAEASGMVGCIAMAAIITLVIYIVRGFLPWFAVNPVGIPASVFWNGGDDPAWGFGMFMAWILKALTLRIGGLKLYTERGRPLALGIFFGYAIYSILHLTFGGLHNLGMYGNYFPA